LLPVTPVLGFIGQPKIKPAPHSLEPAAPTPEALRAVDLAAYGFDRRVDHELWLRTSSRATLWARAGEPCAYTYLGGFFGGPCVHVAGRDPECAAAALRAQLAEVASGEGVRIDIPGTATALVQIAVEAALRLTDPGLLLLSPPDRLPVAHALHSYWLL
jgi:hypothetical protein